MINDPPKEDGLDRMLEDISKILQDNQRFLEALKQDRLADDGLDADTDELEPDEDFEEL